MASKSGGGQPPEITVMRSQLGRVRGLGAAGAGLDHWWIARITSLALVPLTIWFVVAVLGLLGADQAAIGAWVARPLNAALLLALIFLTFHHAQLGLQVVYEDYIHTSTLRAVTVLATKAAAWLLALLAALSVLKLFLAH